MVAVNGVAVEQDELGSEGFALVAGQGAWEAGRLTWSAPPLPLAAVWVPQAACALDDCFPLTAGQVEVPTG